MDALPRIVEVAVDPTYNVGFADGLAQGKMLYADIAAAAKAWNRLRLNGSRDQRILAVSMLLRLVEGLDGG